ncbi:MAG: hypothetical protein QMD46_12565 [Methanomicrobiales archaeon]|nr:hypothetical protein [Methanomicrobiales archaeon]MDI6877427.1 hypothetical protein [Methanomicrobiales archaeon]
MARWTPGKIVHGMGGAPVLRACVRVGAVSSPGGMLLGREHEVPGRGRSALAAGNAAGCLCGDLTLYGGIGAPEPIWGVALAAGSA